MERNTGLSHADATDGGREGTGHTVHEISELLSTVSHELGTPIAAVLGWARLLRDGHLDDVTAGRAVDAIVRNANAVGAIIEDLIEQTRALCGELHLVMEPIDFDALMRRCIDSITPSANTKHLKVLYSLTAARPWVFGDAGRLQQVIINVLSNAVHYTPEYGEIQVGVRDSDGAIEFEVKDSGCGIPEEMLPFVFDRFRRGAGAGTRHPKGLGLGLAIARHLVERHDGSISIHSDGAGYGTTVRIRLPAHEVQPLPDRVSVREFAAQAALAAAAVTLAGVRVLVIEPDRDDRDLITAVLRQYSAEVFVTKTESDGDTVVTTARPDVILCAVDMLEDPYGFVRRLPQNSPDGGLPIPACAMSALVRVEDRTRSLAAGFQSYLRKPLDPSELVAAVSALARLRRSQH